MLCLGAIYPASVASRGICILVLRSSCRRQMGFMLVSRGGGDRSDLVAFEVSSCQGFGRGRSRPAAYTGGRGPGSLLSSLDRLSPKSPVALPGGPDL